jgi:Putative auto-transporter adhesin, head GIN domain
MTSKLKSMLAGAAVAAALIVPAAADTDWTSLPEKSFDVHAVKVEDVVGSLTVNVRESGPVTVNVSGTKDRVQGLDITSGGGKLVISGTGPEDRSVWDWRNWFNFSDQSHNKPADLTIKLLVPKGADVNVQDLVGDATIGDTMGPLRFEATATRARIGKVSSAKIAMDGTGRIDVAAVTGPLDLAIAGSGKVAVGPAGKVKAYIAGAGDATLGAIAGGLDLDIAGSGDVTAASVNGPVDIDIAGSGSVKIANGEANPLHVDIMGSGNFTFGGEAVDPHISALGSGSVRLKSYRGKLSSEGMANVKVGE